jgi:hypothetical protein
MAFKTAPRIEQQVSEATRRKQAAASSRASKNKEIGQEDVHVDLGSKQLQARYKIEVYFGPDRSLMGPNSLKISFWESGRRLHGGGDDLMFMCRDTEDGDVGCQAIFSSECVKGIAAVCPKCQKALNRERCARGLVGKKTTKELANKLAQLWRQLECNADIYCKYDRADIRYVAIEKTMGSAEARRLRGLSIYPLANILKDTAHGASLEDRIFAFLTA